MIIRFDVVSKKERSGEGAFLFSLDRDVVRSLDSISNSKEPELGRE